MASSALAFLLLFPPMRLFVLPFSFPLHPFPLQRALPPLSFPAAFADQRRQTRLSASFFLSFIRLSSGTGRSLRPVVGATCNSAWFIWRYFSPTSFGNCLRLAHPDGALFFTPVEILLFLRFAASMTFRTSLLLGPGHPVPR